MANLDAGGGGAGSAPNRRMAERHRCYIGLGSNLDDPRQHLETAFEELAELPNTQLLARSRLYASRAMGPPQPDYINAVAALETALNPYALLDQLQTIEQLHQRRRNQRWGPRTLDLDLLLYAQQSLQSSRLSVPHPGLAERNFVLIPLLDIAPSLQLPDGRVIAELAQQVGNEGLWPLT